MRKTNSHRLLAACLLLIGAALLQGCLAGAWVAMIASDWGTAGEITFAPFEHSWVALRGEPPASAGAAAMTSIGVAPFEGDADMGLRMTAVLGEETSLRIESTAAPVESNDRSDNELAKMMSRNAGVDAVLFGRVETPRTHPSDWGWSEQESRRLLLKLIDRDGRLLWSDELPYTIVKGSAPPVENRVRLDLADRMVKEIESLQLDELGYFPKKLPS